MCFIYFIECLLDVELTKKRCRLFKRAETGDKCFAWPLSYVIRMNKWFHWPDLWQVWRASACHFMRMLSRLSFLMITVRVIEPQSISEKNVLSKSTFYGHCLFKFVVGSIELLCIGYLRTLFSSRFFYQIVGFSAKSSYIKNCFASLRLLRARATTTTSTETRNKRELTQQRQRWQRKRQISKTTALHVNHAFCTFLYRHCKTTTWTCLRFLTDFSVRQSCS